MKKTLLITLVALLVCAPAARAQMLGTAPYMPTHKADSVCLRDLYHAPAATKMSVFGGVSYAYNKTYSSHGEFTLGAYLPVNRTLEVMLAAQLTTANTYYFTGIIRQIYPLPSGELFTEQWVNDRVYARADVNNVSLALGGGYRAEYVSVQLGYTAQILTPIRHEWHQQTDGSIVEPYNGYYRLEVFCRPQRSPWNLSFAITNYNTFLIERICEPWLIINSHYDINTHCRLHLGVEVKEAGWFHTACEFYGITAQTGFEYRF